MFNQLAKMESSDSAIWTTLDLIVNNKQSHTQYSSVTDWIRRSTTSMRSSDTEFNVQLNLKVHKLGMGTGRGTGTSGYHSGVSSRLMDVQQSGCGSSNGDVEFEAMYFFPKLSFSCPYVRDRLLRLMGSNVVLLTDRKFMFKLQKKIQDEYLDELNKRTNELARIEIERQKELALTGKISFNDAPTEVHDHPVLAIERFCEHVINERNNKIPRPKLIVPKVTFTDESDNHQSGLSIKNGHKFSSFARLPPRYYNHSETRDSVEEFMITDEQYNLMHYVSPLIKQMDSCQTTAELYELAEKILSTNVFQSKLNSRKDQKDPL